MKANLKDKLKGTRRFATIMNPKTLYQRVLKAFTMNDVHTSAANVTPYELSAAHKTHMIEFELNQARAYAEMQRKHLRRF
jgi:hypothetical protein